MKRTRQDIRNEIQSKKDSIAQLEYELDLLWKENALFCDDEQWFTEEMETVTVQRRPKVEEKRLIGKIHWKETFKDQDTDRSFTIERQRIVRIDGEWQ